MGRPPLTAEEEKQFRSRLCETALSMFADGGYATFTLRSLAARMGCSHATPYRYFANREEIFAAVRAEGFRRFADALEGGVASHGDPEKRLRELGVLTTVRQQRGDDVSAACGQLRAPGREPRGFRRSNLSF